MYNFPVSIGPDVQLPSEFGESEPLTLLAA
jgi:hypothetical protein